MLPQTLFIPAVLNTFRGNGSNREVVLADGSTEQGFSERAAALTPRPDFKPLYLFCSRLLFPVTTLQAEAVPARVQVRFASLSQNFCDDLR